MVTAVCAPRKIRSSLAPHSLVATLARIENESTQRKQTTKRFSNRNTNAASRIALSFARPVFHRLRSYPFAPCSHSVPPLPARVLPLEIAPRRLG